MSIPTLLIQIAVSLGVVALYHLWVSRKKPATPAPAPPVAIAPVTAPPQAVPAVEPVPPEIFAVIAAAIATVLGRPHQVLSVRRAAAPTPVVNVWAMEGRTEQFMSHKIR